MTLSQFQGCLIGLAAGDALGAPVEKQGQDEAREYLECLKSKDVGDRTTTFEDLPFGHITDDTQMTVALAEAMLMKSKGFFDGLCFRAKILELFEERIVGTGKGTKDAVKRLRETTEWQTTGGFSGGNGSAIRAAPAGLTASYDVPAFQTATLQSLPTHRDHTSIAGSVAVALATHHLIDTKQLPLENIAGWVEHRDRGFANDLRRLANWGDFPPEQVLGYIDDTQKATSWDIISPWARSCVLWAFYAYMTGDDYMDTIHRAIWCGGDVDSTAAIAGALYGTAHGLEAVPEWIQHRLIDVRGEGARGRLLDLGERLYEAVESRKVKG